MKKNLQMLLLSGVLTTPFGVLAQQPPQAAAITATAPGKAAAGEAVQLQGKIKSVDQAKRTVVVVGPHGNELEVSVGAQVKNFNQIAKGDLVTVTLMHAVLAELKKVGAGAVRERVESQQAQTAPQGEKPAGAIERTISVVADVVAINPKAQTLTLRGPRRSVEVAVNDPALLNGLKIGDQVEARYIEAVAVEVSAGKR